MPAASLAPLCARHRCLSLVAEPTDLAVLNPALVTVSISAFGGDGPKAGWRATDLTVLAAGGQMSLQGANLVASGGLLVQGQLTAVGGGGNSVYGPVTVDAGAHLILKQTPSTEL